MKYMEFTNEDLQDVLYFLVPLTNPHKPSQITVWMVRTVTECLFCNKETLWAQVFRKVIELQVKKFKDHPNLFLSRYVIHMYKFQQTLTEEEHNVYQALKLVAEIEDPDQKGTLEEPIEIGDETDEEEDKVKTRSI
jgi:hypothetical protein